MLAMRPKNFGCSSPRALTILCWSIPFCWFFCVFVVAKGVSERMSGMIERKTDSGERERE